MPPAERSAAMPRPISVAEPAFGGSEGEGLGVGFTGSGLGVGSSGPGVTSGSGVGVGSMGSGVGVGSTTGPSEKRASTIYVPSVKTKVCSSER